MGMFSGVIGGAAGVVAFFVLVAILRSTIKVAPPDRLLVVNGRKARREGKTFGFTVERGRAFVLPYFQTFGSLDLGVLPVNVRIEGVNSANGITVGADATACVCIDDDNESMLYSAVERLMGKNQKSIQAQVQQTLIGNFRGALNKTTPLQTIGMEDPNADEGDAALGERAQFRAELLADINSDLRSFGMKVVSVSLQKIWDTSNYIANLAQKTLADKRREVEIQEAQLKATAAQAESDGQRREQVAKAQADERILSTSQILEVYKRESAGQVQEVALKAEQSIEEAKNRGEAAVQAELITLAELKNRSAVTMEAKAREEAARILADGQREATLVREAARNEILARKAALLSRFGADAASLMFMQQKLPALFEAYRQAAKGSSVDELVVMGQDQGFSDAVNRGPAAFADFLDTFRRAFGIDVRSLAFPAKEAK